MTAKKDQNHQKTVAKAMKTSAKQMEKIWGLHFWAVLSSAQSTTNLEVSWLFAGQCERVRTKATNKNYGKTMKSGQSNGKKKPKTNGKDLDVYFSSLLSSAQSGTNSKVSWLFAGSLWKKWEP